MRVNVVLRRSLIQFVCPVLVVCACFAVLGIDLEWISRCFEAVDTTTIKEKHDSQGSNGGSHHSFTIVSHCSGDDCETIFAAEGNESEQERCNTPCIWNPRVASNYSHLLAVVGEGRRNMEQKLATDYGSYYRSLFYDEAYNSSRGKLAAYDPSHPHGWESLIRRLQLKILHVQEQVLLLEEEQTLHFDRVQRKKKMFSSIWKGNSKMDNETTRIRSNATLHRMLA